MNEVIEQPKVEVVKQEIQAYVKSNPPMTVKNEVECEAAKTRILEVRKEIKARGKWFDDNLLSHSKKTLDAAKAGHDQNKTIKDEALKPLKDWDTQTDANIIGWTRKEMQRVAEEQAKANAKHEAARAKAQAKGKDPDAVKPAPIYQPPVKTAKTQAGAYTIKVNKKLVVYDEGQLPEMYWQRIRNDKLIDQALRSGQEVPGARLEDDLGSSMRV